MVESAKVVYTLKHRSMFKIMNKSYRSERLPHRPNKIINFFLVTCKYVELYENLQGNNQLQIWKEHDCSSNFPRSFVSLEHMSSRQQIFFQEGISSPRLIPPEK